jgi:trk system potassium uptake protein
MKVNSAAEPEPSVAWFSVPTHALPSRLRITLGILAVGSLVAQHGFEHGPLLTRWFGWFEALLAAGFALDLGLSLRPTRWRATVWRARRLEFGLLGSLMASLIALGLIPTGAFQPVLEGLHVASKPALALILIEIFLVANVSVQLVRGVQLLFARGIRPEVVLAGSFAGLILIGTLLLLLPRASASSEAPLTLMDAVFTATSASCVTGLVVRDTGTELSTFGQMTVLVLFQIGGLGIITFVAFISVFSERSLPLPQMVAFRQVINAPGLSDLKRRFAGILLVTLLVEALGTLALLAFAPGGEDFLARLKWALFHAVSAFCNAGFALSADSLESVRHLVPVNLVIMALIILGGLGFLVIPEVAAWGINLLRGRPSAQGTRRRQSSSPRRLSVQTKISLVITAALIVLGFIGFWLLERGQSLREMGAAERPLAALFQSVTARTAGFNTVPIGELRQATLILLMVLMVIGASPVSAGGGIKTVTFGILLLALRSMLLRRDKVEAFGRMLPQRALYAALGMFVLYTMTAATGLFLLALMDPHVALRDLLFETVSALSTVGLSTGITASLSPGSQLVLCLLMFIGRVGPISLVLSIFQTRSGLNYEFPSEEVVVG